MAGIPPATPTATTAIETFTTTTPQNENNGEKISPASSTGDASTTSSITMPSITPVFLSTTTSQQDQNECDSTIPFGLLIQDPKDCGKFYVCIKAVYGEWVKYEFICPGILFFNEESQVCDWPFNVICKNGH